MEKIRIVPLGGSTHVTKNMFVYEYLSSSGNTCRLIVDCGIGFPEEEMLGVDLVLPDISYLKGKEKTIAGIVLTHGHDDHIAGLPFILPELGNLPIFASKLTAGFIEANLADFGLKAQIRILNNEEIFRVGDFQCQFIPVTHSVPDSKHVVINTPLGVFYHGSDFKFDFTPVDHKKPDLQKMAVIGSKGVVCLLSDCLRVEKEGFTPSETLIEETFEKEIRNCPGKFIVTTISSNIHRIQQAVNVAARFHRKVALFGRSIDEKIRVAEKLGYFKMPAGVGIKRNQVSKFQARELCLIVAGSQGQEDSALARIADNKHDLVKIKAGDKVVFSVDPIPGNENSFYQIIDKLSLLGAVVSYSDILEDLHVSGHASSGELKILLSLIKPKFVMPIGGSFRHMNHYRNLAASMGYKKEQVLVLEDGQVVAFDSFGNYYLEEKLDLKTIIVDGSGVGDVGRIVLADRKKMSQEGIVIVTIPVKKGTNKIIGEAEIISRGFVFMKASEDLIFQAKKLVGKILPHDKKIKDWPATRSKIEDYLLEYFFQETARQPMILPVIVKV